MKSILNQGKMRPAHGEHLKDLYTCFKDNPIRRKDPYGLSDSVSDALLEAIAEGNVEEIKTLLWAAQNELTGEEIEIAEQFLAKVAKCEAIHAAYDALNCSSCVKCATRAQIDSAIKCRTLEIALRSEYLWMNCDSCLAGSIARGSAIAKAGHETQLAQKTVALEACFAIKKALP